MGRVLIAFENSLLYHYYIVESVYVSLIRIFIYSFKFVIRDYSMKPVLKFATVIAGVAILATFTLFALDYYEYRQSPEYQALEQYKEWEESYRNDPYGGSTPEETLQLFIDALKEEDIELASKYFLIDKQEEWLINLNQIQAKGLLDEMAKDLERPKEKQALVEGEDSRYSYFIYNDQNTLSLVIDIARGPNGKWKILDL